MSKMGSYCKAYSVQKLRAFEGWTEGTQVTGRKSEDKDGIADGTYLYLQNNFTVTEDIFMDKDIVFYALSPEWIDFCKVNLGFEVPVY